VLRNEVTQASKLAEEQQRAVRAHVEQAAAARQRSVAADEEAVRQQEAAVAQLRAAVEAARAALVAERHHTAATSSESDQGGDDGTSALSRRDQDLAVAERRRLEAELEDVVRRGSTVDAALRVAKDKSATAVADAAAAKDAYDRVAAELPELRERVAKAEGKAACMAQAVEEARTLRAERATQAEVAARRLTHVMGAARDAEAVKEKALRACLRAEAALNVAQAALPMLQRSVIDAQASVAAHQRAQEASAREAKELRGQLDDIITDAAKAQGALAAGTEALAAAAAEEAALRRGVEAAQGEVDTVRRAWEDAKRGLDRARSKLTQTQREAAEQRRVAETRQEEVVTLQKDIEAAKGQCMRTVALIGQVLAQRSDYAAAASQSRAMAAHLGEECREAASDVRALEQEQLEKQQQLQAAKTDVEAAQRELQHVVGLIRETRAQEHRAKEALDSALAHSRALGATAGALERACAAETAAFAAAAAARTSTAAALVGATAKVAALQEQLQATSKTLRLFASQAAQEEGHVAKLKRQVHSAQRSCLVAAQRAGAVPLLESAVASLKAQLFTERRAADAEAADKAAAPALRMLTGAPAPSPEAMAQRTGALRAALADKQRELAERTSEAAAAVAATEAARAAVASHEDGARVMTQLNDARARAFRLQRSVQALTAEIRVYMQALGMGTASAAARPGVGPSSGVAMASHKGGDGGSVQASSPDDGEDDEDEAALDADDAALDAFLALVPGVAEADALEAAADADEQV
jgi:chromosome segregation ATPase